MTSKVYGLFHAQTGKDFKRFMRTHRSGLLIGLGLLLFALLVYLPVIIKGGLIYDDWSVAGLGRACPGIIKSYQCYWPNYIDRPLASLYYGILSNLLKSWAPGYFAFTISFWCSGVAIVGVVLRRRLGSKFALPFMLVALTPSVSSTVIFSPAMQGIGAFCFMLWAASFYCLDRYVRNSKKQFLIASFSLFFVVMCLYESSLPLFILSAFWPAVVMKPIKRINKAIALEYFKKYILPLLGVLLIVLLYQKFYVLRQGTGISKVRILHDPHAINFGMRVLFNDVYIFTLGVINISARGLLRALRPHNAFALLNFVVLAGLFIGLLKTNKSEKQKKVVRISWLTVAFTTVVIMGGVAALHFIAASPPTIVGYLNRALVSGSILIAFIFAFLWQRFARNRFVSVILVVLFVGYMASFIVQRTNYLTGNTVRHDIAKKITNALKNTHQDSMFVLAETPTYTALNFNNETIFSDEVLDWGNFLHSTAQNSTTGGISLSTERIRRRELKATPSGLLVMSGFTVEMDRLWYYDLKSDKLVKVNDEQHLNEILSGITADPTSYALPVDAQLRNTFRDWLVSY